MVKLELVFLACFSQLVILYNPSVPELHPAAHVLSKCRPLSQCAALQLITTLSPDVWGWPHQIIIKLLGCWQELSWEVHGHSSAGTEGCLPPKKWMSGKMSVMPLQSSTKRSLQGQRKKRGGQMRLQTYSCKENAQAYFGAKIERKVLWREGKENSVTCESSQNKWILAASKLNPVLLILPGWQWQRT